MRLRALRLMAASVAAVVLTAGLSACQAGSGDAPRGTSQDGRSGAEAVEAKPDPVRLSTSFADPAAVPIDGAVTVSTQGAELIDVRVTSEAGDVTGDVADGTWRSTDRLEPGTDYVITSTAERSDGSRVERTRRFHTVDLTLDEQTFAAIAPLDGETVGVGMPVVVTFDLPVTDRATFEKHMAVTSEPTQRGSWYWLSDREAHWRPHSYWKPGTDVSVDLDVNSLPAGNGIYGQESRHIDFTIGDSVVSRVDVAGHVMRSFVNGKLARTIPISAGKAGWETRSGTKVIIEKFRRKRMNAATIGVDKDDPEYYDLSDVQYALRVTYSGEFLHGAPWSAGSQGSANVSHGCVGMSLPDARWLYDRTRRGDVVEVRGSERSMTLENGYGDWNLSVADWKAGSALS